MSNVLHAFDLDETLFSHKDSNLQVLVRNQGGDIVKRLSNKEYNNYRLSPNQRFDYSQFVSSKLFSKTAKPIKKILDKLHELDRGGSKIEIVTARNDMDNKDAFGRFLLRHGIDINKIHIRRAGNVTPSSLPTGVKKGIVISTEIRKHNYDEVHLYDDDLNNHQYFSHLKETFPGVAFYSHLVNHNHENDTTEVTTTKY